MPALLVAVGLVLLALACGSGSGSEDGGKQVEGIVLEVVARDILEVESLRVRDSSGKEWVFTTEGFVGFTPSHIQQHQLFGQPVIVSHVTRGDVLVALEVTD